MSIVARVLELHRPIDRDRAGEIQFRIREDLIEYGRVHDEHGTLSYRVEPYRRFAFIYVKGENDNLVKAAFDSAYGLLPVKEDCEEIPMDVTAKFARFYLGISVPKVVLEDS